MKLRALAPFALCLMLVPACGGELDESAEGRPQAETGEGSEPASTCDPLRQDCPGDNQACQLRGQVFSCGDVGPDPGGYGDACGAFAGPCGPGLDCGGEVIVGCSDGFGCCTPYCDPMAPECPGSLDCVPLYSGSPPPNTEAVGVCARLG